MSSELQMTAMSSSTVPAPTPKVGRQRFVRRLVDWLGANKDATGSLLSLATIVAFILGGIWTYGLTREYRDTAPRVTITNEAISWKLSSGSTMVRVGTHITNSGRVLIKGVKAQLIVLRLLPETSEQQVLAKTGKVFYPCTEVQKKTQGCTPEQGLNIPSRSMRKFEIIDPQRSLEPGESETYWRFMIFEEGATLIETYTFMQSNKRGEGGWSSDFVEAPKDALSTSTQAGSPAAVQSEE